MPNICDYEIKIRGSKEAIKRVVDCLKADYNYNTGEVPHEHFFRVFEASEVELVANNDGTFTQRISGNCAWSVQCTMVSESERSSYYGDIKRECPDLFKGTTLKKQSKDCEIEVFSEETGIGFSEHYIFKNGNCVCDDCVDVKNGGYTKGGKPTTKINWDTYDGDYIVFNPHRMGVEQDYKWEIK